jgi:hypothetical protein
MGLTSLRCRGCGRREETPGAATDTALPQTRGVPTFTLYAVLRADHELDDAVVDTVARALGPQDDELCIWRDEQGRLVVSTDSSAGDLEEALSHGRALAEDARALSPVAASVEEIQAMTDEDVLVWRAQP